VLLKSKYLLDQSLLGWHLSQLLGGWSLLQKWARCPTLGLQDGWRLVHGNLRGAISSSLRRISRCRQGCLTPWAYISNPFLL
jgi:hypothetical protein